MASFFHNCKIRSPARHGLWSSSKCLLRSSFTLDGDRSPPPPCSPSPRSPTSNSSPSLPRIDHSALASFQTPWRSGGQTCVLLGRGAGPCRCRQKPKLLDQLDSDLLASQQLPPTLHSLYLRARGLNLGRDAVILRTWYQDMQLYRRTGRALTVRVQSIRGYRFCDGRLGPPSLSSQAW
jgi:hypothetical protein